MPPGGQPPKKGWQDKFLNALADTHMVTEACKKARVSRAYIYQYRKKDAEFLARWEDIEEKSTEVLEQIAVRRAAEGSDNLIMFLLKARRPEIYRENVHHEVSGEVRHALTFTLPDGRQPIEIEAQKRRQAARLLMEGGDAAVIEADSVDEGEELEQLMFFDQEWAEGEAWEDDAA